MRSTSPLPTWVLGYIPTLEYIHISDIGILVYWYLLLDVGILVFIVVIPNIHVIALHGYSDTNPHRVQRCDYYMYIRYYVNKYQYANIQ